MEKTGVAIVGLGNVGAGVARILLDHGDRTARHAGRTLWLTHVVVRDIGNLVTVDLPAGVLTADLDRLIADDSVKVVAQLIGGVEPAREIMLKILESGKDVVTANKALVGRTRRRDCLIGPVNLAARSRLKHPWPAEFRSLPTSANACPPIKSFRCGQS